MPMLMQAVVGSNAYGLAREGSDTDILGITYSRTREFLGFSPPPDTKIGTKPDVTIHDISKYLRLAFKCNPTVTELLWMDSYLWISQEGRQLIALRKDFLSEDYVRNAYLGYASAQIKKMADRDTDNIRRPKHARHCFRLLRQGHELLTTGNLTIKVPDPEFYWQFDHMDADRILELFHIEEAHFRGAVSVLPEKPNTYAIEQWYIKLRKDNW